MKKTTPKVLRVTPASTTTYEVSSYALNVSVLHFAVHDTVVEVRGDHPIYRPGDVVRTLLGGVFHR